MFARTGENTEAAMNHLQRYLVEEFVEDYQEGLISRRKALRLLAGITGAAVASQLLAACGQPPQAPPPTAAGAAPTAMAMATQAPTQAATQAPTLVIPTEAATAPASVPTVPPAASIDDRVPADDPAVTAEMVQFPGGDGQMIGYQARPATGAPAPMILVCHENRGLTDYIQDVTRRVAKAGYVGLAVDLLSRQGGTDNINDPDSIPGLLSNAPPERHVQDFQSGLAYLKGQPFVQADRVGMVGFCFGGGVTWLVAAGTPELRAAVPFYGPPPPADQVPKISAAVLAIYAGRDSRITGTAESMKAAMDQAGKTFKQITYPDVDHAFHNDTGTRYSAEAARDAWAQTLDWFGQHVRG
jgi:carboxymethylenebutenolidase